jgi:hypothetical protein
MTDKTMTQLETLAKHFRRKKTITSTEARDMYGIQSLSRRILDLEETGMNFNRVPFVTEGKRMVKYQIVRAA